MKALLIGALLIGGGYFALMPFASNGYGYAGYGGYHRGPSFFYWGSPRYYGTGRSVRSGSIGGSSVRGGGPGVGK